jgi:nucleoredoxin
MRPFLSLAVCLSLSLLNLPAQGPANPKPASDDPMAGLNLGDSPGSHSNSNTPPSTFVAQLKGHLIVMDHGSPKEFDASTLKDVKYWAFYHSASWCPPCRAFTPQLVDFYKYFKKSHPNFELVFVSADRDEESMRAYMKDDEMTWPALKFADSGQPGVSVQKYFGGGIPDLVLTDENGKVLSDSFHGQDYIGPTQVMNDIKKMVPRPDGA